MKRLFEHFDTHRLNAISITGVARRLGFSLQRAGSAYKCLCPWHEDSHPSLTLYERTGENRCHCFSCRRGGSVIDLVMQQRGYTFREASEWLAREYGIGANAARGSRKPLPKPVPRPTPVETAYTYIPTEMADELVSADNSLCQCLMRMFQPEAVEWLTEEYRLGCYAMNGHDNCTVFPSIDRHGRVCNLKVQLYETEPLSPRFGHCDKAVCYWLGSIWARQGRLPKDAVFRSACLFGEHLLPRYPDSVVALVESPKNALFGALAHQQMTWVATGNKGALRREVLMPLRGRDVLVIPDADAVGEWSAAIAAMSDLANFTVSDFCRRMAPEGQPKFDIADYLQQLRAVPF